jgi:hypothetical protein
MIEPKWQDIEIWAKTRIEEARTRLEGSAQDDEATRGEIRALRALLAFPETRKPQDSTRISPEESYSKFDHPPVYAE